MAVKVFNHVVCEGFYLVPCRDNKDYAAMTGHKKSRKAREDFPTGLPYCLSKLNSDADSTISPGPSFAQAAIAAKAKAIATIAAAAPG